MRRWTLLLFACCSLGAVGCGGSGGPELTGDSPPPSPIPPALITFTPGPVTDVPDPVFGSAPFTLVEAELADLDDSGVVDLGWVAGTASTTTTHEAGSRPGLGNGSFTGDYGGSGYKAVLPPLLATGDVLGVDEEGLVYGIQHSATSLSVATVGYRISGTSRVGVGGSAGASGTLAGLVVSDWDGDGIDDVAIVDAAGRRIVAFRSNGETGLAAGVPAALPAGTGVPAGLAAGSFGAGLGAPDTTVDLVVGLGTDGYVVLPGTGSGAFLPGTAVPLGSSRSFTEMATGDFDADGIPDVAGIVTQAGEPNRLGALLGRGDGTFDALVPTDLEAALGATTLAHLHAADFNGDSRTDLVLAAPALGRAVVLLSDAAGGFVPAPDLDLLVAGGTVGVYDLDGDGDPDLLLGDAATLETRALMNDGI